MSRSQKVAFVVLSLLLIYMLKVAAQGQQLASNIQPPANCVSQTSSPEHTQKVYHIRVVSPQQNDQIEYRKEMASLITQTFADEEKGLFDVQKYRRLKRLAAKLRTKE